MAQYFLDEEVLANIPARLVSCNNNLYDCPCVVILTKNRLCIAEDNFDGTYDYHIDLPITSVISMEAFVTENGLRVKEESSAVPNILSAVSVIFELITGGIPIIIRQRKQERSLLIKCQDKENKTLTIFLKNCRYKDTKILTSAFDKYKSFYG